MYVSDAKGTMFVKGHEGTVLRAYKDQGGVVTIGNGFTNLSPTCKAWFMAKWGRPLRMGDKMTQAECSDLLNRVLTEETGPVANSLDPDCQEAFNAENSVLYNAGRGAAKWKWALAAKAQDYVGAAKLLLTTAITANGIPSQGLRNRRASEAKLLRDHVYDNVPTFETTGGDDLRQVQRDLTTLGYYKGTIDGKKGPLTIGAVKNFQRAYGLKVDGVIGQATRSAIARAIAARNGQNVSLGGGGGTGLVGWVSSQFGIQLDSPWVLVGLAVGVVLVLYLAFLIWTHRGVILRKRTPA